LLTSDEQELFARLSVFQGGCTLEAAEEVCDADLDSLQSLVDKSLLRFTSERFWMLETIREFARELLDARADGAEVERRLRKHVVSLAESRADELQSELEGAANELLEREYPNIRAAMEGAIRDSEPDDIGRVLDAIFPFIVSRAHVAEARMWLDAALAARARLTPDGLVSTLAGGSEIARFDWDDDLAVRLKLELLELGETNPKAARWRSAMLADLCDLAIEGGDYPEAWRFAEQSLAEGGGARAELSLAELALRDGDFERARAFAERALAGYAPGQFNHTCALEILGELERREGNCERSRDAFAESLEAFATIGAGGAAADCLDGLAQLEAADGDLERAGVLRGAADELRRESRWRRARDDVSLPAVPDAALARGRGMGLEEAVAYAFEGLAESGK
jgi:non-specific serine/threonine protein kinase